MVRMTPLPGLAKMERYATISDCGQYRYTLTRKWNAGDMVGWIMLNPSTADAEQDDPTIRKVVGFSERWGFDGAVVANLFAFRSTNPKQIVRADDAVGPDNDVFIGAVMSMPLVVAAWGSTGDYATRYFRRQKVREIASATGTILHCLGTTKSGDPRHPLYVPYVQELQAWSP